MECGEEVSGYGGVLGRSLGMDHSISLARCDDTGVLSGRGVDAVRGWSIADSWYYKCCASAYLSFFFTDCLMSRW